MKFSDADHLLFSRGRFRYPKKLGRVIGVDMAWELGLLNVEPELEFPSAHDEYDDRMSKYAAQSDGNYQQFHKYQDLISESFGDVMPKKSNGKFILIVTERCMY